MYIIYQFTLIFRSYWNDVIHGQIAQDTCLYLDFLGIGFPLDLITRFQFFLFHHTGCFEHGDGFRFQIVVKNNGTAGFTIQASALGFNFPFITVAVAVEADRLTDFDVAFLSSLEDLSEKVEKKRKNNKPSLDGERYYTDKELAVRLKVSRRSLQDYRNNGILPYIQIGGRILYRASDIERTLMDGYKEAYRQNGRTRL